MNNELKKEDLEELFYKNSLAIVFIVLSGIVFLFGKVFIAFDGGWNETVSLICFVMSMIMIAFVGSKKCSILVSIITILIFLISIVNIIYFEKYSMKNEALYHLHKKYNIPYSDMKVIETNKSKHGVIGESPSESRSAIIKIRNFNVDVYYDDGWKDDYKEMVNYYEQYKNIKKNINFILKEYNSDFKIVQDPQIFQSMETWYGFDDPDYGFIIYLNISDENVLDNIINKLDNYVKTIDKGNIIYGLYIIKSKEFYNEIKSKNVKNILEEDSITDAQTDPYDLFEKFGYDADEITSSEQYDKLIFINNGNKEDDEYQDINKYKNIVFWYSSSSNIIKEHNDVEFDVYGIK
jgi:hypothetical protein